MLHDEYTTLAIRHSNFLMEVSVNHLRVLPMKLWAVLFSQSANVRNPSCEKYDTHPSSSALNSFKSLIRSNLKAILNACCELISYRSIIPCELVAAISFRNASRALCVRWSAAFRGISFFEKFLVAKYVISWLLILPDELITIGDGCLSITGVDVAPNVLIHLCSIANLGYLLDTRLLTETMKR